MYIYVLNLSQTFIAKSVYNKSKSMWRKGVHLTQCNIHREVINKSKCAVNL